MKKVVFMGLGYIGLPTAALAAHSGYEVLGVDTNAEVVQRVNSGHMHVMEPDLDRLVKEVVSTGALHADTTPQAADAFFIVVPTPFLPDRQADLSFVQQAVDSIAPVLNKGNLVVIESTSPVHTTERMLARLHNLRPDLKGEIFMAYCPERVLPGKTLHELVHNDRVIGGVDAASTEKAAHFYQRFVKGTLHATNARTAEMCKLTENAARDVQIAFANELSVLCDEMDIDVWELINLANKHPRVHILNPGCGVGGHCIAVDPWFIISQHPQKAALMHTARSCNDGKADWCVEKVLQAIALYPEKHHGRKPTVACMGLAFKPDIDDLRESPAKHIVARIVAESTAEVMVCEPNIEQHSAFSLTPWQEAYQKADIVVWLVKHSAFSPLPPQDSKVELDFCGIRSKKH